METSDENPTELSGGDSIALPDMGINGECPEAVLTPPLSLDGAHMANYVGKKQHDNLIVSRVLNLFKTVIPGSDLTRFQLPPQFNMPKSQLQAYGESVYCYSQDLLSKCSEGESEVERFKAVVAWSISTTRPAIFAKIPYNPILGETHHVSCGNLNVLLEQVSHHPAITALHATNEARKIEMTWWQHPAPRFYGRSVEVEIHGKRIIKLVRSGESYEMNSPKLSIRFFPSPTVEWVGTVSVQCRKSGLEATLCYRGKSLFGFKGSSTRISGKIFKTGSSPAQHLYELDGNWDRTVTLTEVNGGKTSILYDAEATVAALKAPIVQNATGLAPTESSLVWSVVSESILRKDWSRAREAKKMVEEKQRNLVKERQNKGNIWRPQHFNGTQDGGWEYLYHGQPLPRAPIIIP